MSVSAKKDPNGTWHIQYRYTDWTGEKKKSQKRGFKTKKEAEEWLARFKLQQAGDMNMPFKEFWEIYKEDMRSRLRDTTIKRKEYIMKEKLLPYFGDTALCDINAPMIRKWQAELLEKGYKQTYLKSINNELTALMNYAVKYYDLKNNPWAHFKPIIFCSISWCYTVLDLIKNIRHFIILLFKNSFILQEPLIYF